MSKGVSAPLEHARSGLDGAAAEPPHRRSATIVVVSYNTAAFIVSCIESLRTQMTASDSMVVVDNASSDGSADLVRRTFPDVHLVESDSNRGFGGACNLGVAAVGSTDFVLLVNPDAEAQPGMIDALVDAAERRPEAMVYGGRTITPTGRTEPRSCFDFPTVRSSALWATGLSSAFRGHRWFDPEAIGGWDRTTARSVDVVSGSLLMMDRALWDRLGGFDEGFFMYGEDLDLCWRAMKAGAAPFVTPEAVLLHHVGGASAKRPDRYCMLFAGKLRAMEKHMTPTEFGVSRFCISGGIAVRALAAFVNPGRTAGFWREVWRRRAEWQS